MREVPRVRFDVEEEPMTFKTGFHADGIVVFYGWFPRSQKRDLYSTDEDQSAGTPNLGHPASVVSQMFFERQQQILRLTTPKLKSAWGPVRSG
jgi:hypothetical protein